MTQLQHVTDDEQLPEKLTDQVSVRYTLATLIAVLLVLVPLFAYRDYPDILGARPGWTLFTLACIGTTLAFTTFAPQGERRIFALSGLVAGVGGTVWYEFGPQMLHEAIRAVFPVRGDMLIILLGMCPGLLLLRVLRDPRETRPSIRRARQRTRNASAPSGR